MIQDDYVPLGVKATLVVCPQAISTQWESELAQHAPTLRVHVYTGMVRRRLSCVAASWFAAQPAAASQLT